MGVTHKIERILTYGPYDIALLELKIFVLNRLTTVLNRFTIELSGSYYPVVVTYGGTIY